MKSFLLYTNILYLRVILFAAPTAPYQTYTYRITYYILISNTRSVNFFVPNDNYNCVQ